MSSEEKFKNDINYRMYRLRHLAKKHGWNLHYNDSSVYEFNMPMNTANANKGSTIRINYRDMIIETLIKHPKWGNTALIRKGSFTQKIIESIFINPRIHIPEPEIIKSEYQI